MLKNFTTVALIGFICSFSQTGKAMYLLDYKEGAGNNRTLHIHISYGITNPHLYEANNNPNRRTPKSYNAITGLHVAYQKIQSHSALLAPRPIKLTFWKSPNVASHQEFTDLFKQNLQNNLQIQNHPNYICIENDKP